MLIYLVEYKTMKGINMDKIIQVMLIMIVVVAGEMFIVNNFKKTNQVLELILKYIKSISGILSIIILLIVYLVYRYKIALEDKQSEVYGLCTSIVNIGLSNLITINFIQKVFNWKNVKDAIERERLAIIRADKVIDIYLSSYLIYFYQLITPITNRDYKNYINDITKDFDVKDMLDMYFPSDVMTDSFDIPVIELFYKYEDELRKCIEENILHINFEYYNDIYECLRKYIVISRENDYRSFILSSGKANSKMILDIIKNYEGDFLKDLQSGKLRSNIILPYVRLWTVLIDERNILLEYRKKLQEIMNDR